MPPNDEIEDLGVDYYRGDEGIYVNPPIGGMVGPYPNLRLQTVESSGTLPNSDRAILRRALALLQEAEDLIATQRRRIVHLERLTSTDPLTGLLNRRGFDQTFKIALANAKRHSETGILAIVDFNRFKIVNDTMGHAVGDALLRRFAELASDLIRTTDHLARLGGDEFAILLTRASPHGGAARIREIKSSINRSTLIWDGKQIPLDIACGFVAYSAKDNADRLMELADNALYRDKGYR